MAALSPCPPAADRSFWRRALAAAVRGFHAYATWLVSISWKRFALLSFILVVVAAILSDLPPFGWTISETVTVVGHDDAPPGAPEAPQAPAAPKTATGPSPTASPSC